MPKKTRRPAAPLPASMDDLLLDDAPDGIIETPPSKSELDEANALADFQSRFAGKDFKVRIEKFNKDEAEWELVTNAKLEGFDPLQNLRPYGGGRYRLTVLNERGKYVEGGREYVRLADAIKPDLPASPDKPADPLESPTVKLIMSMMQQQASTLTGLMTAMVSTPKPSESTSVPQLIDALAKLNGIGGGNKDKSSSLKETLELLTTAKALLPEPAESSGGVLSEIRDAVQAAASLGLLKNRQAEPAELTGPSDFPPGPVVTAGTPLASGPVTLPSREVPAMKNPIVECVRAYIPSLVMRARMKADIKDTAEFLVAELDAVIIPTICENYKPIPLMTLSAEQVEGYLIEKVQQPTERERIYAFAPELAPYREWVEGVLGAALALLTSPEPEAEPAPVGGTA